ncbi:MAG: TrkA family potassium uptake protein [Propionibacteriaceae bacterium]|jgi:trk system potassium uptake protein TrkA|nr:TrkA family potassium uptake protein [Propionibacteriaceae bacterium]
MRIAIAGAGKAGRSIARELISHGHQVLLIDRSPDVIVPETVPQAEWMMADACELQSLSEAHLSECDVAIAATGDDKANLVHSLLAKTEFGVPRVVARVNHPSNEWLFTESWGVDVAVSTPRLIGAVVDHAVAIGHLARLVSFDRSATALVEVRLPATSPWADQGLNVLPHPSGAVLVAVVRQGQPTPPDQIESLRAGDDLVYLVTLDMEEALAGLLSEGGQVKTVPAESDSTDPPDQVGSGSWSASIR